MLHNNSAYRILPTMKWLTYSLVLLFWTQVAVADFRVVEAAARLLDDRLDMQARIDWAFSSQVEEAIHHGVELHLVAEFRINHRKWGRDKRLVSRKLRASIRQHALSGRYLLKRSDRDDQGTFQTLTEALASLNTIHFESTEYPPLSDRGHDYLAVRARIHNKSLPGPLQPLSYLSPAWRLSSGWTVWEISQ